MYGWGSNSQGQLGTGNPTNSNVPISVDMSGALAWAERAVNEQRDAVAAAAAVMPT